MDWRAVLIHLTDLIKAVRGSDVAQIARSNHLV